MNDETDKELHKQADKGKRDLDTADGVVVSDGTEREPPPKVDPFEARKALFKKSDEVNHRGEVPAEEGKALPVREPPVREPAPQKMDREPEKEKVEPPTNENEYVTLTINGKACSVKTSDIERAGGKDSYIRQCQLDEDRLKVLQEKRELEIERQNMQRDAQQRSASPKEGSATSPSSTNGQDDDPGESATVIHERSQHIAEMIYSGDLDEGTKAIEMILRRAESRGEHPLSVDEVARRVKQMLAEQPAPETRPESAEESPSQAMVRMSINDMVANEYPKLLSSDVSRSTTIAKIREEMQLPENANRRAIDVARDACEWAMSHLHDPRAGIVERKRGLPSSNTASGARAPASDADDEVPSDSDFIAMQQRHRQFGKRA